MHKKLIGFFHHLKFDNAAIFLKLTNYFNFVPYHGGHHPTFFKWCKLFKMMNFNVNKISQQLINYKMRELTLLEVLRRVNHTTRPTYNTYHMGWDIMFYTEKTNKILLLPIEQIMEWNRLEYN